MDLARLIAELSRPGAYPYPVDHVEVRQTHVSAVFLAGEYAYKIKKPVAPAFLDFSTLDKRRKACEDEVRLNRRLAPDVYLGVVPVAADGSGVRFEAAGEPVEWAVKMRRLPDEAALSARLTRGEIGPAEIRELARRIAAFHASAERGPRISRLADFAEAARNVRNNLDEAALDAGTTIAGGVYHRLRILTEDALANLKDLIERRAARNIPCDTHGDLKLEHIYLFPDRQRPDDLVILDCIEFNERFRFADPVADTAFLAMDLIRSGRRDLAGAFADEYFSASRDDEGRALMPMYVAYRAAVRGKVEGLRAEEPEVPAGERDAARQRARACWLLALGELEIPDRRPALLLTAGLPGTGKSSLAHDLGEQADFYVIRTDAVRKELAARRRPAGTNHNHHPAEDVYTPEWNDRTYAECLRRTEELLFEGRRVVVDGNFRDEARRRAFLDAGRRWGVPTLLLNCQTPPEVAQVRLAQRNGDASDADWGVRQRLAEAWEQFGPETRRAARDVPTGGTRGEALAAALRVLEEAGLAGAATAVGAAAVGAEPAVTP